MYNDTALHVLDTVNSPTEMSKKLSVEEEMKQLAEEMRQRCVKGRKRCRWARWFESRCSQLTISFFIMYLIHLRDKIVWDVSHQSYGHKLLTGRKNGFEKGHYHESKRVFQSTRK